MNSGCICCSLVGDFGQALEQVLFQFHPDRILIEPSGVGKLSDVIGAVQRLDNHEIVLNAFVTVADATKCKIYMKNFGEFFNNQIEHAAAIVLSRTSGMMRKNFWILWRCCGTQCQCPHHHHTMGRVGWENDPGNHGKQGYPERGIGTLGRRAGCS